MDGSPGRVKCRAPYGAKKCYLLTQGQIKALTTKCCYGRQIPILPLLHPAVGFKSASDMSQKYLSNNYPLTPAQPDITLLLTASVVCAKFSFFAQNF